MRNRGRLRLRDICGISHIQVRENERMEANNACVMDSSDRPDCIILAKPAARAACAMRACGATMGASVKRLLYRAITCVSARTLTGCTRAELDSNNECGKPTNSARN